MRKGAHRAESISEVVEIASAIRNEWHGEDDDPWGPWFRGQQRTNWGLSPKLYRDYGECRDLQKIEDEIREEFTQRAPILSETPLRCGSWEWYFLMQHFGAPTRLLDWTEGALIALYFAVRDNPGHYDAAVWILDPYELNKQVIGREVVIPPSESSVAEPDRKLVAPWLPDRQGRKKKAPYCGVSVAHGATDQYPAFLFHDPRN